MKRITASGIKSLQKPGKYRADPSLYLNVAAGGSKSWIQRITIKGKGKHRNIGLGGWPLVSLAEAREVAFENRKLARRGIDPLAEKRRASIPTFREAAISYHAMKLPTWKNAKVAVNFLRRLENHAFARLGDMPVDTIGREAVLEVLTPIWTAKPETARKVRGYIRATLDWCIGQGFIESNIAGDPIKGALPRMPSVKEHFRALDYREVSAALDAVKNLRGGSASDLCLRLTIFSAVRSGEARNAVWAEFNLVEKTWKIPAARMKTGVEHRVPLSDAALAILEQARSFDDGSGLVFPSPNRPGKPLSDMTLTKLLRSTGFADRATVHGFRSSFRDWAAESGKPREIAEAALAHVVGGVEASYFRSDLFELRRQVMDQWAAYLISDKPDNVVSIRKFA